MRPPDRIFHYGPPENSPHFEPRIRPICERINQSGWLWTVESCEGHGPENPHKFVGWGDHKPMIRFGCRTEHIGHLILLLKRATKGLRLSTPVIFPGWTLDEEWSDVLTCIDGQDSTEKRRQCYAVLAELAHTNPPPMFKRASAKKKCPSCDTNNVNAPCNCCE